MWIHVLPLRARERMRNTMSKMKQIKSPSDWANEARFFPFWVGCSRMTARRRSCWRLPPRQSQVTCSTKTCRSSQPLIWFKSLTSMKMSASSATTNSVRKLSSSNTHTISKHNISKTMKEKVKNLGPLPSLATSKRSPTLTTSSLKLEAKAIQGIHSSKRTFKSIQRISTI